MHIPSRRSSNRLLRQNRQRNNNYLHRSLLLQLVFNSDSNRIDSIGQMEEISDGINGRSSRSLIVLPLQTPCATNRTENVLTTRGQMDRTIVPVTLRKQTWRFKKDNRCREATFHNL
uniref:ABC transporter D family member 1 n=1 Tax=Rhizophora mucronata TaxID=61149 RepID=A0A2P2MUE4_RHIMU